MAGCCGKVLRQLWLLVWKNLLFRKRQFVVTGFEILLPALFALFLALFHSEIWNTGTTESSEMNRIFPIIQEQVRYP
jgi:hypothetical protein